MENLIKVEPYWNVNFALYKGGFFLQLIKVEPYWNVNLGTDERTGNRPIN